MSGHVFISHASENRDEANELVSLIEAKGMTAWIAPRDVRPGFDYSEELQRALENCAAFVVLVTENSNVSPYVRAETEMAFSCQKPMLPIRMADVKPAPGLAFFLKIRHWTDAFGTKRDAALSRLVLELQTLTGNAPSWAPKAGAAAPPPLAEDRPAPPPPAPPPPAAAPPPSAPPAPAQPAAAPPAAASRNILPWAIVGGGLLLIAILVAVLLINRGRPAMPGPGQDNGVVPAPTPPGPQAPARTYGGEMVDFGVPPKNELESNVGTPTPLSVPGGQRITTEELQRLIAQDPQLVLVDVLAGAHPQTLPNALYMPAGGMPGSFDDAFQAQFAQQLAPATGGDLSRPVVFFCQGASCWESYNAVLRAAAGGHTNLYWYRGGLASWQEAALPMGPLPSPYGDGQAY